MTREQKLEAATHHAQIEPAQAQDEQQQPTAVPDWLRSAEAMGERLLVAGWRPEEDAQWARLFQMHGEFTARPAQTAPVQDEREAFSAEFDRIYSNTVTTRETAWRMWQASAALTRPAPAVVQQWISVKDRLPPVSQRLAKPCEIAGRVLPPLNITADVQRFDGKTVTAGPLEWFDGGPVLHGFTDWMPLADVPAAAGIEVRHD
jgi:hypothetical protein